MGNAEKEKKLHLNRHTCHTYDRFLQDQANHLQTDILQLLCDLIKRGGGKHMYFLIIEC